LAPADTIAVFAEPGHTWLFVSALDWPGWARRGKTEELALATLESYLPRYAPIVARAELAAVSGTLVISERHQEPTVNADFGTLHEVAPSEHRPLCRRTSLPLSERGSQPGSATRPAW
jgi:hypothetical protein